MGCRHRTLPLALAIAAVPALTHAQALAQAYEHPPPPEGMSFTPIEENPYFTQDARDPRFLVTKPGLKERGIDRGYVERMARGDLPSSTLDVLERDAPAAMVSHPLPVAPEPWALPNMATVVSGNVIIVEGNESIAPMTENGRMFNHNGQGLQYVVQQVWSRVGDYYDFITVMTTFKDAGAAAYYMPLRQDVTGLGECDFNAGATFGCVFETIEGSTLQGFVFMNGMDYWRDWDWNMDGRVYPLDDFEASVYAVMGQEVAHRWGSGLRFKDPRSGAVSKRLLGRDESHWAAFVDTDASVMDGWDWRTDDDGGFTLVDDMRRFSTLDLYTMGALPVAAARPFFFIDGARFMSNPYTGAISIPADAALQVPSVSFLDEEWDLTLRATGERVDLTIQDIVDAEGNRCPDPDHTQKSFRQAIVLVTSPGMTAASAESQGYVDELELMMATWEQWWSDRTNKALTLCTNLAENCEHAEAGIGPGEVVSDDGVVDPGESFELVVPAFAKSGDAIQNARVTVALSGNGAEQATLAEPEIGLGELAAGESTDVAIPIDIADDYSCGYSMIARVTVEGDNAAPVSGEYRIFPGYKEIFSASFDSGDDGFTPNADGLDDNRRGGFVRDEVSLNCTMSPRTPEDDASPGGGGAFVTGGEGVELDGTASLFSPEIDLAGAVDPEIRFMYWLDGAPGAGRLKVSVSGSGEGFTEAKVYEEPYHGWVLGRVVLSEVYDEVPASVWLLIEAQGDGRVEAAIDEVRVLDRAGKCAPLLPACACSAESRGRGLPFGAVVVVGLLAGLVTRRRRR